MFGDSATADLVKFILILIGLWLLWVFTGGPERFAREDGGPFLEEPFVADATGSTEIRSAPSFSQSAPVSQDEIELDQGNARYEASPDQEYVVIRNRSQDEAVNITGWQLVNNPARPSRSRADVVLLPPAAKTFSTLWAAVSLEPVSLPPGGQAIVYTGVPPSTSRWPARTSFRTNKCLGYLSAGVSDFHLAPSLPYQCPQPSKEAGVEQLADDCYDLVRNYSVCRTPQFTRDREGYELLDGRRQALSATCRAYLLDHFSYDRCLAWHQPDADFYGSEWRLYLNRSQELWAKNREKISLYDNQGRLVDDISY